MWLTLKLSGCWQDYPMPARQLLFYSLVKGRAGWQKSFLLTRLISFISSLPVSLRARCSLARSVLVGWGRVPLALWCTSGLSAGHPNNRKERKGWDFPCGPSSLLKAAERMEMATRRAENCSWTQPWCCFRLEFFMWENNVMENCHFNWPLNNGQFQ